MSEKMAYLNQTNRGLGHDSALGAAVTKIGAAFSALADSWRRASIYRDTYSALDALSTRELDDLGLSRSMISRVAFDAAYGPKA